MPLRSVLALALLLACALGAPAEAAQPTGRWLVVFEDAATARPGSTLSAALARTGVRRAGRGVPELGIATVEGRDSAIRALRSDRAVKSVSREWYRDLRRAPNDPALSTPETEFGSDGSFPVQWALARQRFPFAWDVTTGGGARVAVLDTGIEADHPELGPKIVTAEAVDGSDPHTDPDGHGTHVSGLACAATDDGRGVAGAGWDCGLNLVKLGVDPLSGAIRDEDIINGIRIAADRRPHALNMSFGGGAESAAMSEAIQNAFDRGVVMVAAASNCDVAHQGAPASQLQPNDAPDIDAGRGLVVTAAEFSGQRARNGSGDSMCGERVGHGAQISLAAFGFFHPAEGPPGVISTWPDFSEPDCSPIVMPTCIRRDFGGDDRYAYLQGTSMATPQVTALAALVAELNPFLSVREKLTILKRTAQRSGSWSSELGWGIIDAGAAVEAARRVDTHAPSSRARSRRRALVRPGRRRAPVRVRWSGRDEPPAPRLIASGVRCYALYAKRGRGRYRSVHRCTRRRSARLRLRPGTWHLYTRARDRVGNLEAAPRREDARVRVRRARS